MERKRGRAGSPPQIKSRNNKKPAKFASSLLFVVLVWIRWRGNAKHIRSKWVLSQWNVAFF